MELAWNCGSPQAIHLILFLQVSSLMAYKIPKNPALSEKFYFRFI